MDKRAANSHCTIKFSELCSFSLHFPVNPKHEIERQNEVIFADRLWTSAAVPEATQV